MKSFMQNVQSPETAPAEVPRIERAAAFKADDQVRRLLAVGRRGLPAAYLPKPGEFAQTVRGITDPAGVRIRREGTNLRYAAMAALGINRLDIDSQRHILAGTSAAEFVETIEKLAQYVADPGAVALAAWVAAEVSGTFAPGLFSRLESMLASGQPMPTVDVSWMLTAAAAAHGLGDTKAVADHAAKKLLAAQGARGIFPHTLPAWSQNRWREHVGSFADQVYPIQALARMSTIAGDRAALESANMTAQRLCELQGSAGQWWWHYDIRTGDVVEGFPVYSVHQHAMAPMVLFDLAEAGGDDHTAEIIRGLRWLDTHPEVIEELVSERFGLIWRKVGRREPAKTARSLSAVTTSLRPGMRLPGLDRALPPVQVDYECRPYELGWLLYAWLPERPASEGLRVRNEGERT